MSNARVLRDSIAGRVVLPSVRLRARAGQREEDRMLTDEHHAVNTMIDRGAALFAEDQTATRCGFGAGHCIPNAGVGGRCDREVVGVVGAISEEIAAVQPLHAVVKEGSNTASSSGPARTTFDACTVSLCEQFS